MTKRFGVPQARQDRSNALTAFTLAEVLITLGIIGVVAAMTIPTLISNTNGAQFKTAYKKALSTLNQAVLMNIAMDDTDFSTIIAENSATTVSGTKLSEMLNERLQSATEITDTYFQTGTDGTTKVYPALAIKYEHECVGDTDTLCKKDDNTTYETDGTIITIDKDVTPDANWEVFSFADGTSFGYNGLASKCSSINETCVGFIDVNGSAGPNTPIDCSSGTATEGQTEEITECDASKITDIFPVFFHGQTVEPANDSARAVLFGK